LTARVKLLAPEAVRDAWATFVRAEDAMFWELWEDPDGFHNGGPYLKAGTQSVLAASRAAGDVHAALRAAMNDPDLAD
jgi:hypothetical protein